MCGLGYSGGKGPGAAAGCCACGHMCRRLHLRDQLQRNSLPHEDVSLNEVEVTSWRQGPVRVVDADAAFGTRFWLSG